MCNLSWTLYTLCASLENDNFINHSGTVLAQKRAILNIWVIIKLRDCFAIFASSRLNSRV